MLDFKVGKVYKDTDGKEWKFIYYDNDSECPYLFREKKHFNACSFYEQKDNTVTYFNNGTGKKIPFVEVEDKERDWVVGEEYECFDAVTQRVIKARLTKIIKKTDSHLVFIFHVNGLHFDFHFEGIVLVMGRYVIFKDGVPQELKDRLNKSKLTNKQKCFQKGIFYKDHRGVSFLFLRRIKTKFGVFALFEVGPNPVVCPLYRINNVEVTIMEIYKKIEFCADESIRNEDTSKAVRIMQ